MESKRVRVRSADDHGIVRDALRLLLSTVEHVEVIGKAGDGIGLQALPAEQPADLLLLDLNMPGLNRLQFIHELHQQYPRLTFSCAPHVLQRSCCRLLRTCRMVD